MKRLHKIILLGSFTFFANVSFANAAGGLNKPIPKNNDSVVGATSNIVIFKMITTPAPATNSNSGSLKKAGKVARTSNSRPVSYTTPPIHWVKPYS